MTLRTRFAVTLLVVAVPVLASANWLRSKLERRAASTRAGVIEEFGYASFIASGFVVAVLAALRPVERRLRELTLCAQRVSVERRQGRLPAAGDDEVSALARAVDIARSSALDALEAAQSSERSLRDIVENTTHDVMLPLTVLQGQVTELGETLMRGGLVDRDAVQGVLEELHYLGSLIRNLRTAIRLESGRTDARYDPISLAPVIERVVLRHATIARERRVELDFAVPEEPVLATGDETLIEQALSNVVHNAVRYNTAGGHVAVLLDVGDERFSVRVIDDGPGVSDAELARLADRSFRGDNARARHPGGTGLGLAIAKDIAERHGFVLALRKSSAGGLDVGIEGPTVCVG